ncbi:spore germination protein [Bacillus sp. FJAT-52991]|uniref:Spore germination protein n=1 Tax=Bacillus kandeliae TaxID=3129297 RepID=A0ABZ2N8C2_9BACI
MPAIIGTATIINVSSGGIFNIGDVYQIHPVTESKTFSGAGSFNYGHGLTVSSGISHTNLFDEARVSQETIGTI